MLTTKIGKIMKNIETEDLLVMMTVLHNTIRCG
jgi:hypothetical protein